MCKILDNGVTHRNPFICWRPQMLEILGFWSVPSVSKPLLKSGRGETSGVTDLYCPCGNMEKHWVSLLLIKMPTVIAFRNLLFLFLTDVPMYRIWVGLGTSTKWLFGCWFCIKTKQSKQQTKEPEDFNRISICPKIRLTRHFPQRKYAYPCWEKQKRAKQNKNTKPSTIRNIRTNRAQNVRTHLSLPLFPSYL